MLFAFHWKKKNETRTTSSGDIISATLYMRHEFNEAKLEDYFNNMPADIMADMTMGGIMMACVYLWLIFYL